MRLAHRPFLIMLLITGIASLWTGGNAWHVVTCGHHDHGRSEVAESACSHSACCHHAHASPVEKDSGETPLAPDHDHDSCPVCQWYTLHHASMIATVELVSSELFASQAVWPVVPHLSGELVRYCQPRAPPQSV